MRNRTLLVFLLSFFITSIFAQNWKSVNNESFKSATNQRLTTPSKYESYELDFDQFISFINNAPKRFESKEKGILIQWPMPDNKTQTFEIKRSDVFHPDLAAKYPEIKAFTGHSKSDPTAILKISVSHKGFEGMLLSNRHETIYLDRFSPKSKEKYILYKKSNYYRELKEGEGTCTVEVPNDGYKHNDNSLRFGDCQLRKFRLALACTGEYAEYHGGNKPDVLAEYNASLVRINGIFERDLAITLELISNTDELIFLSANTDPYTNDSGSAMLSQNQTTVDQIIGFDNYDIGHVYSTGGGGVASLRSPCTARKARGVTGQENPTGDFFWVDYVAHEMGHQFGGNHTFNNSCLSSNGAENRNSSTAAEPGSGTTIMAYAGICSPNLQTNSDDYFHSISQSEIANFVVAGNGTCAELISIDNSPPEIESITQSGQILPSQTPFFLTTTASDADNDLLTYCWEQLDIDISNMPPEPASPGGPMFRSFDPDESPIRYFPRLTSILTGSNGSTWEVLPNSTREMDFNVTVRDNNPLGGCTTDEELTVSFTNSAGPFLITSQNTFTTWNVGDTEIITWDVANTDQAPVSCANVDIVFSLNRGKDFDIVLAENVPNTGEYVIDVPFQVTSLGRIMLKCSTSTFFDINNTDINIIAPFTTEVSPSDISLCPGETATYTIDYTVFGTDPVPVTFNVNGLPSGSTHNFSPEEANEDTQVILTIDNLTTEIAGTYNFDILVEGQIISQIQKVSLTISTDQNEDITYLTPEEGQTGIPNAPLLTWDQLAGITNYEIEVSESPNFVNIVFSGTPQTNFISASGLESEKIYYWRVRGVSLCVSPSWNKFQSFQTGGQGCTTESKTANITISETSENTVESIIELDTPGIVGGVEVSLNIDHTWVGDLSGSLKAPNGIEIRLFERPGAPETEFGCGKANISVAFSSDAPNSAEDFENTCNTMGNAIDGMFQPLESFSFLNDALIAGPWTLVINDFAGPDGGELLDWTLTTCTVTALPPGIILKNNILDLNSLTEGGITNSLLEIENTDASNSRFILRSAPSFGDIQRFNTTSGTFEALGLGDSFTQEEINTDMVKYVLSDIAATNDSFLFDTEDNQSRYTSNNTFLIISNIIALSISADITNQISCFGETDGRIEVMGNGGIPGYLFSINNGSFETQNVFENLSAGEYTIKVKDNLDSEVTSEVLTIIEPTQLTYIHFIGNNEITIDGDGGTGVLQYSLDGTDYTLENTIEIFNGETYRIHVKDENGCITQSSIELTFYQINNAFLSVEQIACKGSETGGIHINDVDGGLSPYTYQLNEQSITFDPNFINLPPGMYVITIRDNAGNVYMAPEITISEPEFALEVTADVDESSVVLNGSGGTGEYIYNINGGPFQESGEFMNLPNGEYTGYVTDSNGCIDSVIFIIMSTSTNEINLQQLQLMPNPANVEFTLSSPIVINFDYQIIDVTGKVISQNNANSNGSINIEHLTSGLYMIKVSYRDSSRIFKLSKI